MLKERINGIEDAAGISRLIACGYSVGSEEVVERMACNLNGLLSLSGNVCLAVGGVHDFGSIKIECKGSRAKEVAYLVKLFTLALKLNRGDVGFNNLFFL